MHFTAITQNAGLGYRSTYEPRWLKDKMSLVREKDRQTAWHRTEEIGDVRTSGRHRQVIDCFLAKPRLFVLLHHVWLGVCGNVQQWHCDQCTDTLRPMRLSMH